MSLILGTVSKHTSVPLIDFQVEILIYEVLVYTNYKKKINRVLYFIVVIGTSTFTTIITRLIIINFRKPIRLLYHNRCYAKLWLISINLSMFFSVKVFYPSTSFIPFSSSCCQIFVSSVSFFRFCVFLLFFYCLAFYLRLFARFIISPCAVKPAC